MQTVNPDFYFSVHSLDERVDFGLEGSGHYLSSHRSPAPHQGSAVLTFVLKGTAEKMAIYLNNANIKM